MKLDASEFPMVNAQNLKLSELEKSEAQKEAHTISSIHHTSTHLPDEVQQRFQYSKYIIDPNH